MDDCQTGLKISIERSDASIRIWSSKDISPVINRTQFLLMLAWGCTVHKFQGITLVKLEVSFNLLKQNNLSHFQTYVAFGRMTSLNGL